MKTLFTSIIILVSLSVFGKPPPLSTYWTTNTTPVVQSAIDARAVVQIAADTTKQPAKSALTNLVDGDGTVLASNVSPAALSGAKFTGIVTNISTLSTNVVFFSNGIVTNATRNP